jgi:glutamyl-tRNA synthetase
LEPVNWQYFQRVVPLIQERLKLLSDSTQMTSYFFAEKLDYDSVNLVQKGMDAESTVTVLQRAGHALVGIDAFESANLEQVLRDTVDELEFRPREFFGTLREAITGRSATPSLFEVMEVLGRDRVLARISDAIKHITR